MCQSKEWQCRSPSLLPFRVGTSHLIHNSQREKGGNRPCEVQGWDELAEALCWGVCTAPRGGS